MFEILPLILFVLAIAGGQFVWTAHQLDVAVKEWCSSRGFIYLKHTIIKRPFRRGRYGPMQAGCVHVEYRRGSTGELEGGNADWMPGTLGHNLIFHRPVLPDAPMHVLPQDEVHAVDPAETQISIEVARRLDSITQKPGWIEAHDLDGSGHIDSEEWDILRERVIAEVRAELEVAGAERNRANVPVAAESADEGWW